MTDSSPSARPRVLTIAAWVVVGGSLFQLLWAFDTFSTLNTLDARNGETLKLFTSGFGLSVDRAISAMRFWLTIVAVCSAAAAILGFFVLQRHRGARVALSVLVVPGLLVALLFGELMGAFVAAACVLLWTGQSRDWFAGRPIRQLAPTPQAPPEPPGQAWPPPQAPQAPPPPEPPGAPGDADGPSARDTPPVSTLSTAGSSTQPGATTGFGGQPSTGPAVDQGWSQPAQQGPPQWGPVPGWGQQPGREPVPVAVRTACILTWVFSGTVALIYVLMLGVLIVAKHDLVDVVLKSEAWSRSDLDRNMLVPVLWVGCLIFLGWSLGACLLAWFAWRRQDWARWLLAVSAVVALLAATFAIPVGIVHQIACAVTIGCLFNASSRAWFAGARRSYGPPPGPPPGSSYGPPAGWTPPTNPPPTEPPASPPPANPPQGQDKPPVW